MSDGKINVVVVDDHMITRSFFETTVKTSDKYNLLASFPSAEEAAEYLKKSTVDLVVMDILMRKGIDGLTAAGIIKNRHPEIKIILATSTAEAKWLDMAREIGVESFWYKELEESPLLYKIRAGQVTYLFDRRHARITSISKDGRELLDRPVEHNFFRAPMDNDKMKDEWYKIHLNDYVTKVYETSTIREEDCTDRCGWFRILRPAIK